VTRRRLIGALLAVVVVGGVIATLAVADEAPSVRVRNQFIAGTPEPATSETGGHRRAATPVELDTSLYLPETTPAPAVLLAHGFGGTKQSVAGTARTLAQHGYVVLTYTARGFGRSGGLIHFDAPAFEVHDAELLVSYLAALPQVRRINDQPQIGVEGGSYGGGLALLLAGSDPLIKSVAADITWNNLTQALFPNGAGDDAGVFKKLWVGELFGEGFGTGGTTSCGRFAADVCAAYQASARTGIPTAAMLAIMKRASPSTVLSKITAPTLLSQGESDSLFGLGQADANARGIAATGTPVKVLWRTGGHDDGSGGATASAAALSWFDQTLHGKRPSGVQSFSIAEQNGSVSASTGRVTQQRLQVRAYPLKEATVDVALAGPAQQVAAPAGGTPAAVTSIPGLSGLLGDLGGSSTGDAVTGAVGLSAVPSQVATFVSPKLSRSLLIAGTPRVSITVTTKTTSDVTLFASLRDVTSLGTSASDPSATLPNQLVAPLRLTGMTPGKPRTVTISLPSIAYTIPAGHRVALVLSTTDFAYLLPQDARSYTISLASPAVSIPTVSGRVIRVGHPLVWLIIGLGVCLLAYVGVSFELRRRRRDVHYVEGFADIPVVIDSLVKEYAGGYRAVDGVSLQVERGQVLGLLGPNGAGKTTTLRVLVGLILPTSGTVHVFGEPIVPGADVLARLGAFIEGPGFLPHLSGRENLRLFWAATNRPKDEAYFDTALDIAGLGSSVDRRVRTYSHGMKQRLGIAQAMLGLPELLVLDEPTNGLDPPQIAEMREVLQRYAATGRTVVVSSHLLAEVEQTCTHVAVMHKGQLVAAGSVAEIAGAGGMQLAVGNPEAALAALAAAGIAAELVPARRALEDVFLDLIGDDA
jgi:ABC-2 type transport system ATP-binding protein